MARKRLNVELTQDEYEFLTVYVARGHKKARYISCARTLLMSHDGKTDQQIVDFLDLQGHSVFSDQVEISMLTND